MKTEGVVIESRIESIMNGDAVDYTYNVKYRYHIEGKEYLSDRLFFKTYDFSAERYDKKYPVDKKVIVYYNPNNKNESVLETGIKSGVHLFLLVAIIFLLVFIFIYFVHIEPHWPICRNC